MSSSNDSTNSMTVSPQVVILFCLLGAAGAVLCAWAIFSRFYDPPPPPDYSMIGNDGLTQAQYMRTVRMRNYDQIRKIYGFGGGSRKYYNSPTEEMHSDQDDY